MLRVSQFIVGLLLARRSRMDGRWIRRKGTAKSGFRYANADGSAVRDPRVLQRISRLRVPPAWRDVHIAAAAGHAVQAWGFDARGRKQYRYHDTAVVKRELRKYHRVRQLAKSLPRIRRLLRAHSRQRVLTCETACAIALRLISESLFRPGSEKYLRENRSYGMTTLRKRHVRLDRDRAIFAYTGKASKKQRQLVTNPELLQLVARLQRTPGDRLFRYRRGASWCDLNARELIAYVRRFVGPFAVKDFRTWGATLRVATVLAEVGAPRTPTDARRNVMLALRIVSSELGNTPAICRSSYVHPMVLARYMDEGETIVLRGNGRSPAGVLAHSAEEKALIAFLDRHFPERRRKPRQELAARAA
jgi:DNA topoisomerase-1